MVESTDPLYIGDGVYVNLEDGEIVLRIDDAESEDKIFLNAETYNTLVEWVNRRLEEGPLGFELKHPKGTALA